jgi:sialic acid synthase SpsE
MDHEWNLICQLADARGVSKAAISKWRERASVPHKWRIQLMQDAAKDGHFLPVSAFDRTSREKAQ